MKPAFWLPALFSISSILNGHAQHAPRIPVVSADGPTIIAFFPIAAGIGSGDGDGNEALSDFEYYSERVTKPLSQIGIRFTEEFERTFRIRSGSENVVFTPKSGTPGYYFVQHGKKPRIEYGVMTDADILVLAKQYFGFSHLAVTPIPELFSSVAPDVKAKSRISLLLPDELSGALSAAKYANVEKASDDEYAILLYSEQDVGNAGFIALFAAKTNPGYEPQELTDVLEVKLSHGQLGYFRPVSCGGSCAPANLWWKEDRVLYQIQLRLSPHLSEKDQQGKMISVANSAILAGPR